MRLNCGDNCPKTGSYTAYDENGKEVKTVHVNKGDRMPPTQIENCYYESDD